jgi:hypothetical protein
MRTKRRAALALATAAACGAGLIALTGSTSALSFCTPAAPNPTAGNQSCVNGAITPNTGLGSTFKNASLYTHVATRYLHPGNKAQGGFAKSVSVLYDSDGRITPGTIPKCTTAQLAGKNISQAWNTCGPGAGAAHNAYLSPATAVSGRASTAPPSNFNGCTLVFRGPTVGANTTVILYTRITLVVNGTANCNNPAGNTAGNSTVLLTGTIAPAGVAGFGKKLAIPGVDALPLPLDDFTALLKRGTYFKAKCSASPWRVRGTFAYSGTGQAADTSNPTQTCQVGQGSYPARRAPAHSRMVDEVGDAGQNQQSQA